MADLSHLYRDGYDTDEAAQNANTDYAPVPKGTYRVKISSADVSKTKAGNGEMLKVRLDIVGPAHAGRVIFDDILIVHPSEAAQRIGRERLATLARATGLTNPANTDPMIGKEVDAFIKIEKDEQYGDRNKVSFYSAPSTGGLTSAGASAGFDDADIPF